MERDAHYGAVGAFVVVVLAMASVFVLWYTDAHERREYRRYEVYFTGSVSGLNEGSAVRYLGVHVGRVARIRIDPRDLTRVLVVVDVEASTPINHGTLARLTMQGVTGQLFIDLMQETRETRGAGVDVPSQTYPVIRSVSSGLDIFLAGLPDLVASATHVTGRLNELLSDQNLHSVAASLNHIETMSASLPETGRAAATLITELRELVGQAKGTVADLRAVTSKAGPSVTSAADRLATASDNLAKASGRLDDLLRRHEADLDRFATQGLGEFAAFVRESRLAAKEVAALARALREEPTRLLYVPRNSGVEIAP
jgi:phospholipid/cholesterol/gamma-HCH transport system substrate-binding protein